MTTPTTALSPDDLVRASSLFASKMMSDDSVPFHGGGLKKLASGDWGIVLFVAPDVAYETPAGPHGLEVVVDVRPVPAER
ncbi:MAG: hypothetical protein H7287_12625 [Thermoleophilia bacterium]|nr:hypothetical protein [Thermoleophilia bacterium]